MQRPGQDGMNCHAVLTANHVYQISTAIDRVEWTGSKNKCPEYIAADVGRARLA